MSSFRSRKRITVFASVDGVKKAERALIRLGFESKSNFAKSQLIARNAVTKFFKRDPIQLETFKRICDGLQLGWREICALDLELDNISMPNRGEVGQIGTLKRNIAPVNQLEEAAQAVARQVTVVNQQQEIEAVIVLQGDITSIDTNFKTTLEVLLRIYAGCTIQVTDIQPGSIRVTIKGDKRGIEKLIEQFAAEELTTVAGFSIENIRDLEEKQLEKLEEPNSLNKWNIIQELLRNTNNSLSLKNVDLSDTDLSGADLSGADLSGADLSGADLSGADLSDADLRSAYLSDTDLSDADLRGADLSDADLSGACLRGAYLRGAYLRGARINEEIQMDGKWHLVWRIVNKGASGNDLSGANLRGANLRSANLRSTILRDANLSDTDLRGADLSGADLRGAILRDADLRGAILRSAILRSANLRSVILNGADVQNAQFGEGWGLSDEEKQSLLDRGAIFDDALGGGVVYSPNRR